MGKPSHRQIADAIIHSAKAGESDAEFDERLGGLNRLSDDDLAAMGIVPPTEASPSVSSPAPDPANAEAPDAEPSERVIPFEPAPTRRIAKGWTAERQCAFLDVLAETGCVSEAAREVNLTPRSAYRLRDRPGGESFAKAWVHAQTLACTRLTALAFERAVHGTPDYLFRDGVLVAERRRPSDRLLMWLLTHFDSVGFGWMGRKPMGDGFTDPRWDAAGQLPELMKRLADVSDDDCPTDWGGAHIVAENEPDSPA